MQMLLKPRPREAKVQRLQMQSPAEATSLLTVSSYMKAATLRHSVLRAKP